MSTRCNVLVVDDYGTNILFYRHSDGYPEGVKDSLDKFCSWVNEGKIRGNAEQSSGWLILAGIQEYAEYGLGGVNHNMSIGQIDPSDDAFAGWKIGAYEPSDGVHGDIEWFHIVKMKEIGWDKGEATWTSHHIGYNKAKELMEQTVNDLRGS